MNYFLMALSIIFISCNTSKPITVQLHPTQSTGQQLGQVTYILDNIQPDSFQTKLANKLKLRPFIISLFDHLPKKSQETEKSEQYLDSKTIFLTGLRNDSVLLIVDLNNNNQLDDDKIITIDKNILKSQSTKNLDRLPIVQVKNLQAIYDSHRIIYTKKIFLLPDTIRTGELTLQIVSNEQKKGKFNYKGKKYYVQARQKFSGQFVTESEFANIRIDRRKNILAFEYAPDKILHLNDTARIGNFIFTVEKVDPLLDRIVVKPILHNFLTSGADNIKRATNMRR